MRALVLSGGGARGAYQAGVLHAIGDIVSDLNLTEPAFPIITGVSAGALNGSFLAAGMDQLPLTCRRLTDLWSQLDSRQVFYTDAVSIGKIGLKWVGELGFGALTGASPGRSLLDTAPLWDLIKAHLNFERIQKNIDDGYLHALGITALDYRSSELITFIQGQPQIADWKRSYRHSERAQIRTEHIVASSAIPILFPPAPVGDRYFGDGAVRNLMPISPAIHMGATKVLVIGVRKQGATAYELRAQKQERPPSVARTINVLLNSVLMDGVEVDLARLDKINDFIERVPQKLHSELNFKKVSSLFISPEADLGELATEMSSRLPRVIRYMLKGLGPMEDASELVSYLLFESEYTKKLIQYGYEDGMRQRHQIEDFFQISI